MTTTATESITDKYVDVRCINGKIEFPDGGDVEVKVQNSKITFQRATGSEDFEFAGILIWPAGDNAADFSPALTDFSPIENRGTTLVVHDKKSRDGRYDYCLAIVANGRKITRDPQIVNKT